VIFEALVNVSTHLGRLDAVRARTLLEIALKLAQRLQRPEAVERVNQVISKLPASSGATGAGPAQKKTALVA
jgi:hypothetical protein